MEVVAAGVGLFAGGAGEGQAALLGHGQRVHVGAQQKHGLARAEDGGRRPDLREQFDLASARAVARLSLLCEYCLPFVRVGGCFCALKGYEIEAELLEAKHAIGVLGGAVRSVEKFILPDQSRRAIVVIEKVRPTGKAYPRNPAKIAKEPL